MYTLLKEVETKCAKKGVLKVLCWHYCLKTNFSRILGTLFILLEVLLLRFNSVFTDN